jgi:Ca2+/Na+ antiporter
LLVQLLLGSVMVVVTVVIQVGFTVVGIRALRRRMSEEIIRSLWHFTLILAVFVLWLFLATVLQMWAWALLYLLLNIYWSTRSDRLRRQSIFPWKRLRQSVMATWFSIRAGGCYHHSSRQMGF